jgi:hypothetical protein
VGWFFRWVFRRAGAGWMGSLLHPAYGLRVGMDKVVEVRAIGHRLDREGGEELMKAVAYRAAALSQDSDTLPVIEMYWT